jgi:hypothetical protein
VEGLAGRGLILGRGVRIRKKKEEVMELKGKLY